MPYPQHGAGLDATLADVDTRLHTLETAPGAPGADLTPRVVALEEANEAITERLDVRDEVIAGHDTSIGAHDEHLAAHDQSLQNAFDATATLNSRIETLTTRADGVDTSLASLADSLTTLEAADSTLGQWTQTLADQTSQGLASLDGDLTSLTGVVSEQQGALDLLAARVATIEGAPPAGTATAWPGTVVLDSFAGANSTEKFRAALAYAAAASDGRKPAIILPPGTVLAPGSSPFMLHSGAAILGGVVPQTEFSSNSRVTISGAAPNGVFDHANDARSIVIANIGWEGPGQSQVCRFMADGSNRLLYSLFSGLSFDNFTSVLRKRFLGFLWEGMGYCNNSTETPFEFSGSDYKVFMSGYYLDSPHLADDEYLLHIKSGNKVTVGEVFVTGDGPTPVRVSGGQMVRLRGLECEAEGVPRKTAGAALFVSGGNVVVDNLWTFRTMTNPAGTGRGDNGVVHVEGSGTLVRIKHATFGEYNVTPERPDGHVENHVHAGGSSTVYLEACAPWNMQGNSGVGSTVNARALKVSKAGTGRIFASSYVAL